MSLHYLDSEPDKITISIEKGSGTCRYTKEIDVNIATATLD